MSRSSVTTLILASLLFIAPLSAAAEPINDLFAKLEKQYEIPSGILAKTACVESQCGQNIRHNDDGPYGMFQWIRKYWGPSARLAYGNNFYVDPSERANHGVAAQVTADNYARIKARNGDLIQQAEINPTLGLYMGHFMGQGGSEHFLLEYIENPNQNAAAIFPVEARANPNIFNGRTLTGVLNLTANKLRVAGVSVNVSGDYDTTLRPGSYQSSPYSYPDDSKEYRTYPTIYDDREYQQQQQQLERQQLERNLQQQNASPQEQQRQRDALAQQQQRDRQQLQQQQNQTNPFSTQGGIGQSQNSSQTLGNQNTSVNVPSASLIIAQSSRIGRGKTTLVSWVSVGMKPNSCRVTHQDTQFATGNQGSKILSAELTATSGTITLFLTCTPFAGISPPTSVSVVVQ